MASVRVLTKKEIRLDKLNFSQRQMFNIGNVGVASVKARVSAALGPNDTAAKPLSRYYAIKKTKMGKGNRRNLTLTGNMLRNFMVRTVTERRAVAANTTRKDRDKARANERLQPWVVFSPKNKQVVTNATRQIFLENRKRLVLERYLGGKQR